MWTGRTRSCDRMDVQLDRLRSATESTQSLQEADQQTVRVCPRGRSSKDSRVAFPCLQAIQYHHSVKVLRHLGWCRSESTETCPAHVMHTIARSLSLYLYY